MEKSDFTINARSSLAGIFRAIEFFTLIAVLLPFQVYYALVKPNERFRISQICHRGIIKLLGFRLRIHGTIADTKIPIFFVANHTSYLDIPVLGALLPAAFVAKSDVAHWPLIGFLAKMQNTVFIERRSSQINTQRNHLRERLAAGQNLIVFPEGTSSDGHGVLSFKSALFSVVEEAATTMPVVIQPISVICTELDGMPLTRALRPLYSWYGDMTLPAHLWNVFKSGHFTVDVTFHPPVTADNFLNRKTLATYCQQQIAHTVQQFLTGRGVPVANPPKLLAKN
jgi:1-acyl-sn-glycerol-3-phosphate acyltransferase